MKNAQTLLDLAIVILIVGLITIILLVTSSIFFVTHSKCIYKDPMLCIKRMEHVYGKKEERRI